MKTPDIIVSILFTIAIFGPIFYLYHLSKSRSHKMMSALKDFAAAKNFSLTEREVWGDKALGYDPNKRVLLFLNHSAGTTTQQVIHLNTINDFELISSSKVVQIQLKKYSPAMESIVLYDALVDEPMESGFHVMLAKKWIELIKVDKNSNKTNPPKAA